MTDPKANTAEGTASPDDDHQPNEHLKSLAAEDMALRRSNTSVDSETLIPTTPVSQEVKPAWARPAPSRLGQAEASTSDRGDASYRPALGGQHKAMEPLGRRVAVPAGSAAGRGPKRGQTFLTLCNLELAILDRSLQDVGTESYYERHSSQRRHLKALQSILSTSAVQPLLGRQPTFKTRLHQAQNCLQQTAPNTGACSQMEGRMQGGLRQVQKRALAGRLLQRQRAGAAHNLTCSSTAETPLPAHRWKASDLRRIRSVRW